MIPTAKSLPKELVEFNGWCVYGKDKVPLGREGNPVDVQNTNPGMSFNEACKIASRIGGGIGFCFVDSPFAGVDIDKAFQNGIPADWAAPAIDAAYAADCYVEISMSGSGVHIIGKHSTIEEPFRTNTRRPGGGGIERYVKRGYFAITGNTEIGAPSPLGLASIPLTVAEEIAQQWTGLESALEESKEILEVTPNPDAEPPADLLSDALASDPRFRATWNGLRPDLPSASEYDLALASLALGAGWTAQQTWDLVIAGRRQRGEKLTKALRVDYARSTLARAANASTTGGTVGLTDFYAHLQSGLFIYRPSRELWPAKSIDALIPKQLTGTMDSKGKPVRIPASMFLAKTRYVEQTTWAPGEPELIRGRMIAEGGWLERPGSRVFNYYLPPSQFQDGDATKAQPWLDLIAKVFPEEHKHIIAWLAHRVQRPGEKINHAIVLGGVEGVGKDTILHPIKHAVGPWNFQEIAPAQIMGRFNGFIQSVVLRVSEARDQGDVGRYAFYDHTKTLLAAPPDVLRVDEKYAKEKYVPNICGVIFTTNHRDALFIPPTDRRHHISWSPCARTDFSAEYWNEIWHWYEKENGIAHVSALLAMYDLSQFDPKAAPPITTAYREAVEMGKAPEDDELHDALEAASRPDAVTFEHLALLSDGDLAMWIGDRKRAKQIAHRMNTAGYVRVVNPDTSDGRWFIQGKKRVVFAKAELPYRDQVIAAKCILEVGEATTNNLN